MSTGVPPPPKKPRAPRLSQAEALAFAAIKQDAVFRKAVNLALASKPAEATSDASAHEMIRSYARREGWDQAISCLLAMDQPNLETISLDEYRLLAEPDYVSD
jgi:hypothetical protein